MISQDVLDLSYAVFASATNISMLLYAPFARTWRRALIVQSALAISWAVLRFMADIYYDEDAGPGIFYLIVPLESVLFASLARIGKRFVFKVPVLSRVEETVRSRFRSGLFGAPLT